MSHKTVQTEAPKELIETVEQSGQVELFEKEPVEASPQQRTAKSSTGLKHIVNGLSSSYNLALYDLLTYEMRTVFLALFLPAIYKGKCYTCHELLELAKKQGRNIGFELSGKQKKLVVSHQFEALYKAVNTGLVDGNRQVLIASLDKYAIEIFKDKKHDFALSALLKVSVKTIQNIRKETSQ